MRRRASSKGQARASFAAAAVARAGSAGEGMEPLDLLGNEHAGNGECGH